MKAIVTGGAGFIGSHLVDRLLAQGDQVLVIDNFSTGRKENLKRGMEIGGERLEVIDCDIRDTRVDAEFERFKPDQVFHLAAQMNVRYSVLDPVFDCEVNTCGTVRLLEAARKVGVKKFIFSSTGGAIYGEQETFPAPEDHPTAPKCPYGVSKRSAELYLSYYAMSSEIEALSMRFANVYGPRQNSKGEAGVVAIFCERALANSELRVNGDGLQTRDYVFVSDVVSALSCVSQYTYSGGYRVYNVGTGCEHTVLDIVHELRDIYSEDRDAPKSNDFRFVHGPEMPGEQRRSSVDSSRLRELGWSPRVNFSQGIRDTFLSFAKSGVA